MAVPKQFRMQDQPRRCPRYDIHGTPPPRTPWTDGELGLFSSLRKGGGEHTAYNERAEELVAEEQAAKESFMRALASRGGI